MRMDDDIIYRRDWDFAVYYTIFVFDLGFTLYIVIYIYLYAYVPAIYSPLFCLLYVPISDGKKIYIYPKLNANKKPFLPIIRNVKKYRGEINRCLLLHNIHVSRPPSHRICVHTNSQFIYYIIYLSYNI